MRHITPRAAAAAVATAAVLAAVAVAAPTTVATAAPTLAAAPTVATAAPVVASTSATLRCTVEPGGLSTSVWVTYKPSSAAWGTSAVVTTTQQVTSVAATLDFPVSGLAPSTSYDQRCKAKNSSVTAAVVTPTLAFTTTTIGSPGVVVAVAGDNCDDSPTLFAGIGCRGTAAQVQAANPASVIALGDLQYNNFATVPSPNVYEREWGAFKAKTIPVLGNHELVNPPASQNAYDAYWGARAHKATDYQWREDLGRWSVVVVNSNYSTPPAANVRAVQALVDAANADGDNIVMVFHHPRFSSPCNGCHGPQVRSTKFYKIAYDSGVDLVLTAHDHRWEKFAPMSSTGPAADGVREFLIGSGGAHPDGGDGVPSAGSQLIKGDFVGVTFFTLSDASYSWDAQRVTSVTGAATTFDSGTQPVR